MIEGGRPQHPDFLKLGVRLIMRVWRNKDNPDGRRPGRTVISTNPEEWETATQDLLAECIPGERVYASAEARNVDKAIRVFKERQLAADYDATDIRHGFYHECFTRWLSCLGAPQAAAETYFLFDCDDQETAVLLANDMQRIESARQAMVYRYPTKSGEHVLTRPFNPAGLTVGVRNVLQKNPLLLVGWV